MSAAVRAFCGDSDVAHETTQEAFARCFARWRKLEEEPWVEGWVTTTAINLTRRHFGQRKVLSAQREQSSPAPTVERLDLMHQLRALPERQRQAVVLHYLLDLPIMRVAELMRVSDGAVKSHLHKARGSLRTSMETPHG